MDSRKLKDTIFALKTRRFGTFAEIMAKKLHEKVLSFPEGSVDFSSKLNYDLYDTEVNRRIECKFSRVQKKATIAITEATLLEALQSNADRNVNWEDRATTSWDCNIQQIKKKEFDSLMYGLFFNDIILFFTCCSEEIGETFSGYSNKQHRGNEGEGQFHITNKNLQEHIDWHLIKKITYEELLSWLT